MLRILAVPALALLSTLAVGPAVAAPAFAGTNTAPGEGGDFIVDCNLTQFRNMPFCQMTNTVTPAPTTTTTRRLNQLPSTTTTTQVNQIGCPVEDLIVAGTDRNGDRLYRCAPQSSNDRVLRFRRVQ